VPRIHPVRASAGTTCIDILRAQRAVALSARVCRTDFVHGTHTNMTKSLFVHPIASAVLVERAL